jgi:hypothetical protein
VAEELIGIILGSVDARILSLILINGFLVFYIYFYNSSLWSTFSDFDKLFFSVISGFVVYLGLIFPLADIAVQFANLINGVESTKTEEILFLYKQFSTYIILGLVAVRVFSGKAPSDNIKIFKAIFSFLFLCVCLIYFAFTESCLALLFSPFREYLFPLIDETISNLVFMGLFIGIYYSIHKRYLILTAKDLLKDVMSLYKTYEKKIPHFNVLLAIILLLVVPCTVNEVFLDYDVSVKDEKIQLISIKKIDLERNELDSATELIFRDYSIKMPRLFLWAKVKPDLILKTDFTKNTNLDYIVLEDENAFIVNKTSKLTNVTVSFYNETDISYSRMVMFKEPISTNNSMFMNISLNNYLPYNIEIEDLAIPVQNYTLEESDFVKTQFFADNRGGIRGYTIEDETLYLTYVHLEKNASGTINLKLLKSPE